MMESVLVDTDIFSFFFKKDSRRDLYVEHVKGRRLCLSFMTVAELRRWAIERNWGERRRASLAAAMQRYVVIPYDDAMADAWARITAQRNRIGQPITCGDCWIAAAAARFALPLITHNERHYTNIPGLKVISHAR